MILKSKLRNIFYISLLLAIIFSDTYSQLSIQRFENRSIYKGNWEIDYDVPSFIADYLREKFEINVFSPRLLNKIIEDSSISFSDLDDLFKKLNSNLVMEGKINNFTINRFVADLTQIAGYDTYKVEMNIEFIISDLNSKKIIFQEAFENTTSDVGVGIRIFGNNTDRRKEYLALDNMKFDSPEFLNTLVAKSLLTICEDLSKKTEKYFRQLSKSPNKIDTTLLKVLETRKNPFTRKILRGEIVMIDNETNEVFINLGYREMLTAGEILNVYSKKDSVFDTQTKEFLGISDKKVGEIEILEVRGEKFSLAIIRNETEKIKKGMEIRKIIVLPR